MNKYESDQVAPGCTSVGWSSSRNIRLKFFKISPFFSGLKLGYFWVMRFGIAMLCHRYVYSIYQGLPQMVHRNGGDMGTWASAKSCLRSTASVEISGLCI